MPVSGLLAISAIRLGALSLALATLSFGLVLQNVSYQSNRMFGYDSAGISMRPPMCWLPTSPDAGFCCVVLALGVLMSLLVVGVAHSQPRRLIRSFSGGRSKVTAPETPSVLEIRQVTSGYGTTTGSA